MKKIFVKGKEKITALKVKLSGMPKKKLAIVICTAILISALIIAGIVALCVRASSDGESIDTSAENVFNSIDESGLIADSATEYTPQSANELEYSSNGDGTCAVVGIGTYSDTEVKIPAKSPLGDVVEEIGDEAFSGCSNVVTVTVPATVKHIGDNVFRGCSSLMAIYVSSSNSSYCSVGGVLFTKDKSTLVLYPQMRPGVKYLLPSSVKVIEAYAFEGIKDLGGILYEGSMEKFQRIEIKEGNELLKKISVTCNYIPSKP